MNSPLFRPFPHFVGLLEETKTPVLEWDFDGTDLFFRPQGGDVEIVWTYLGRSDVAAALQKPSVARATIIKIGKAMNARKFWRMWPLKDGSTTFLRGSFGLLRVANTPIMVRFDLSRSTFGGAQKTYEAKGARQSSFDRTRRGRKLRVERGTALEYASGQLLVESVFRARHARRV